MPSTLALVDEVVDAVQDSLRRRGRLEQASATLDRRGIDRRLKALMRSVDDGDPEIVAVRAQRQVALDLEHQIDDLERALRTSVSDLESLAARHVASAAGADSAARDVTDELGRLRADADALDAARREVNEL